MAKSNPDEMSFLDHLEELRWHLIRATLAILIVGTAAFIMKDLVFSIILGPKDMDFPTYRFLCKAATKRSSRGPFSHRSVSSSIRISFKP